MASKTDSTERDNKKLFGTIKMLPFSACLRDIGDIEKYKGLARTRSVKFNFHFV